MKIYTFSDFKNGDVAFENTDTELTKKICEASGKAADGISYLYDDSKYWMIDNSKNLNPVFGRATVPLTLVAFNEKEYTTVPIIDVRDLRFTAEDFKAGIVLLIKTCDELTRDIVNSVVDLTKDVTASGSARTYSIDDEGCWQPGYHTNLSRLISVKDADLITDLKKEEVYVNLPRTPLISDIIEERDALRVKVERLEATAKKRKAYIKELHDKHREQVNELQYGLNELGNTAHAAEYATEQLESKLKAREAHINKLSACVAELKVNSAVWYSSVLEMKIDKAKSVAEYFKKEAQEASKVADERSDIIDDLEAQRKKLMDEKKELITMNKNQERVIGSISGKQIHTLLDYSTTIYNLESRNKELTNKLAAQKEQYGQGLVNLHNAKVDLERAERSRMHWKKEAAKLRTCLRGKS